MPPVRVLRIIARLNVGGPAIHATSLTERLDPTRYHTLLVTGHVAKGEQDYRTLYRQSIPHLVEIPELGREIHPLRDWRVYRQLVGLMREFRPDIVHTHTAKAGLIGRLAAWRTGVPIVVHTFHGHVLRGYFSRPVEWAFVLVERVLARVTSRLVTVGTQVREEVLARGIGRREQFVVVRLGFDLARFARSHQRRGQVRQELGLDRRVPLIGIVARLVPIKAHEVFLRVAARVLQDVPHARFLVVGDGECRPALEAWVAARNLQDRITFLGWRADLDAVYADLDVVVLTSRNEGSPVALIEAMASGCPVVSTRVGGVEELVGSDGELAGVDDVEALAAGVLRVLRNPEHARERSGNARARVLHTFSQERLLSDIDTLYQELLAASRR